MRHFLIWLHVSLMRTHCSIAASCDCRIQSSIGIDRRHPYHEIDSTGIEADSQLSERPGGSCLAVLFAPSPLTCSKHLPQTVESSRCEWSI